MTKSTKKPPSHTAYPRSSSFYAYSNCPVSFKLSQQSSEEPPTPQSDRGTVVHMLIANKTRPDGVEEALRYEAAMLEEARFKFFAQWFGGSEYQLVRERRLWLRVGLKPIFSGAPDAYSIVETQAVLSDYKTGWHPLDEIVATNCQIRSYAALIFVASDKELDQLVAAIHKPGAKLEPAIFDRDALSQALDWSIEVATRAVEGKGKPVRGPWCKYCSGKVLCPLWRDEVSTLAEYAHTSIEELPDSQLRSIAPKLALAASVVERLQDRLYTRVKERPEFFSDWRFEPGDLRRKVTDVVGAYNALVVKGKHLTAGEFLAACRLAINEVELRLRKKNGLTVKRAQDLMASELEGVMESKPNRDKLVYDPKAESLTDELSTNDERTKD